MDRLGRPRALTLDDDASMRLLLRATLEVSGFDVLQASAAQEALERLADPASRPDVLVLEPVQGRRWTSEIFHLIRQHLALEELPIVVVTRAVGERERSKALGAGADVFVPKPFSPASLAQIVITLAREGCWRASETTSTTASRGIPLCAGTGRALAGQGRAASSACAERLEDKCAKHFLVGTAPHDARTP